MFTTFFLKAISPPFSLRLSTSALHNASPPPFISVVEEYNALQVEAQQSESVSDEKINAVQDNYVNTVTNSGYAIKHDASVYLGSFEYIFSIVLTCVIFTAVSVLIGWLLFRKKKTPKFVPYSQRKATTENKPKPQPAQFTRDVFNAEEDDVVEEVLEEGNVEASEESKSE